MLMNSLFLVQLKLIVFTSMRQVMVVVLLHYHC
jgi:hypothetical protein